MAAKKRIFFFLEDAAQEAIIPPLFTRVLRDEEIPDERCEFRTLNSRGGDSIRAYRQFLDEVADGSQTAPDVVVVGSDGNCKGYSVRRDQLRGIDRSRSTTITLITSVPDPHVERWYMLDPQALAKVVGCPVVPAVPAHKCAKDHYKQLLRDAFRGSGVTPPLGGAEYGPGFARHMDLYAASKHEAGFGDYIAQIRSWVRAELSTGESKS